MGEIEDLLAQMKAEYQKGDKENPLPSPSPRQEKEPSSPEFKINNSRDSSTEAILKALSLENQEREQQEVIHRQQEALERQKTEALKQQRKREALTKKAKQWLDKLDAKSEEGRWFEEFSYAYDSPLEAAITYLEALGEVNISNP
jgi:hypothetical protein